jgi:bifunctional non-homologous end joining protein LigD
MATRRTTAALPARFEPQLATLVKSAPVGDDWLHEIKFDGYRIAARLDRGRVALLSRRGNDWAEHFPAVREAVAKLPAERLLIDGEVAAVLPDGRTSFQGLQNLGRGAELAYFVFDLLHLDGEDVARLPLEERKARLERLLASGRAKRGIVRYSAHVAGGGAEFFAAACQRELEGIVSKRRDRPYEPGRHGGWVKTKCWLRQEVVIGGFTEPAGSRVGLGALLVGVHDHEGRFHFAGKVGTGFSHRLAVELRAKLDRLARPEAPFVNPPREWRRWRAHWVAPTLVGEVAFTEWTNDGRMRHPSFQGLREDKPAREVVRERAVPVASVGTSKRHGASKSRAAPPASSTYERPPRSREKAEPGTGTPLPKNASSARVTVAGVSLSHPERVLYPEEGITKLDLARYYEAVAEWIVPDVAGRPLTLVRCPNGLGSCFYMKHTRTWHPPAVIRQVRIREQKKVGDYAVVDTIAGIVALAQMNILEIHTWNTRVDHLEMPDRIIIDLDPGPEVRWKEVVATAHLVRDVLKTLGLASFAKTTGGKGVHVVAPFVPQHDWDTCLAFARGVAETIAREHPQRYSTSLAKAGREDKILLDYLRNNRGSTAVAAFSTRARPGCPVAVPIAWDELTPRLKPDRFDLRTVRERLRRLKNDPWREYGKVRQRLRTSALAAVRA